MLFVFIILTEVKTLFHGRGNKLYEVINGLTVGLYGAELSLVLQEEIFL